MNGYHTYITYDEILNFWAKERPEGPAIEQDGRITSFAETDRLTRQIIGFYWDKGLKAGDRIAWLGKNSDLYSLLYMAAARCGVVMVPVGCSTRSHSAGRVSCTCHGYSTAPSCSIHAVPRTRSVTFTASQGTSVSLLCRMAAA